MLGEFGKLINYHFFHKYIDFSNDAPTRVNADAPKVVKELLLSAKTFSSHIKNKVVILAWIPTFFVTFVFAPKHQ